MCCMMWCVFLLEAEASSRRSSKRMKQEQQESTVCGEGGVIIPCLYFGSE